MSEPLASLPTLISPVGVIYFSFATLSAWTLLLIAHFEVFLAVADGAEILPRPSSRDAGFCAAILSGYITILLYLPLRPINTRMNKEIAGLVLGSMAPLLAIVLAWIRPSLGALIVLWTTLYAAYLPFQRIKLGTTLYSHPDFIIFDMFLLLLSVLVLVYLACLFTPAAWHLPRLTLHVAAITEVVTYLAVFPLLVIFAAYAGLYSELAAAAKSELSPSVEAELKPIDVTS